MWMRNIWIVLCLCFVMAAPAAGAGVSQEPGLRKMMPTDALGYIRIPNVWGLLSDAKGSVLDDALKDDAHARLIAALREAVGGRFRELAEPAWAPLIDMIFFQLASPIEMILEMPANGPPQMTTLLASATLSIDSLEGFNAFLAGFVEKSPGLKLMGEPSADGYAALGTPGMPIFMRFDPDDRSFRAMAGMSVNEAAFKERLAGLAPVDAHPMYAFEDDIDQSRQGLFIWLNVGKIMPLMTGSMSPPEREVMEKWGLSAIRGAALGWGVSGGNGRLTLSIDAPKAGYRALFPDIENDFDLWASGMPETVFSASLPLKGIADAFNTMEASEGRPEFPEALQNLDAACRTHLGMPLDDVLGALGPEMIIFSDEVDAFFALKIGDKEKWDRLIGRISHLDGASMEVHERQGKIYRHLKLPSIFALADKRKSGDRAERLAMEVLKGVRTHLYWTEDNGYLVFASAPQALYDRADHLARVSIRSWVDRVQDARHAALHLTTRLAGTPSKVYYAYLQLLTLLGDMANHPVDLFSLPSARQAHLPSKGDYGFQLSVSDPVTSLSFTFENNPLEFLLSQDASGAVAAAGVITAIAIPNFIEYRTRARDAEASAAIKNAYTAAQAYFVDDPSAVVTMENLEQVGYRPGDGVVLTIEDGGQDTLKMSSYHVKGKTVYTVDAMGNIESFSK